MLTCKHGCGWEHHHRGAMNIHESVHCKMKTPNNDFPPKLDNSCFHAWRFLKKNDGLEQNAIRDGYEEVCDKCLNVR